MGFLSKTAAAAVSTTGGGYLNPSKIQDGGSVRFALLSDQPLEYFECWGESADGKQKPFRFDYQPTPEDVRAELGDFTPRTNDSGNPDLRFGIAVPVFAYDSGTIKVLSITQKGILKELDELSQDADYENLLAWDFTISREGTGLTTKYKLRPAPRKKGSDDAIQAAWSDAQSSGFDLSRLMTGGNPFSAA